MIKRLWISIKLLIRFLVLMPLIGAPIYIIGLIFIWLKWLITGIDDMEKFMDFIGKHLFETTND